VLRPEGPQRKPSCLGHFCGARNLHSLVRSLGLCVPSGNRSSSAARTLGSSALTFAAGVGRCKLVFVDCAAQKGLLSIAQRRAIRLSLSTVFSFWLPPCSVPVSVGASRQGRCLVNTPFGTLNHYRAFFEKGRTHRTPSLSVSIRALGYWPKALPI
jgi:hypothetical protein